MKLVLAAAISLLSAGAALAADPVLPNTGSAQGVIVPHALPGEPTHRHDPAAEGHLIAPSGQQGQAAEQGITPPNSLPGGGTVVGLAQPHADVLSPRAVVPEVGSAQGASPLAAR